MELHKWNLLITDVLYPIGYLLLVDIVYAIRYFSFLEQCKDAKACTVLLRGGSKDVLNEVERNLADAMQVSKNYDMREILRQ